jgi:hypothetical protein
MVIRCVVRKNGVYESQERNCGERGSYVFEIGDDIEADKCDN